jgi:hypothetical protein
MAELTEQQKTDRALRIKLRELCATARRDAALFAIFTVLLTPVAIIVFILALLFALAFVDLPVVDYLGYSRSFVTGVNLCLAFMFAAYFLRPKAEYQRQSDDLTWLMIAAGLFGGIIVLTHLTPLLTTHPVWFWTLYLVLALGMLGCIGHAYEPHDDYYLGWTFGPYLMDDPFTIDDDIDRAHIGLGFAAAIAHLILSSYGEILGSRWLWRGLLESELHVSVSVLQGLAAQDSAGVTAHMQALRKHTAADIMRALVKLELVTFDKARPRLSHKGREFLEQRTKVAGLPV